MLRTIVKIFLWLLAAIMTLVIIGFIAFQISPRPGAYVIARLFDGPVKITDKPTYEIAHQQIAVKTDLTYVSKHKKNTYDLYLPKHTTESIPVLIWVHGGGYVGGDKTGMTEFATKIAADANIAVVSMNYELAPDATYPSQVTQVHDLIQSLQKTAHPDLDLTTVMLGGDSAGAQIALQYATIESNPAYAKEMKLTPLLSQNLKGVISYCGPVDLQQTAHQSSTNQAMRFFVKTVAWSLLGEKNWQTNPKLAQASLVKHVTKDFPPTYITDGNAYSFQEQGLALENRLKTLNVPVTSLFYTDNPKQINHEYQFDYSQSEAQTCYAQTLTFLKQFRATTSDKPS